ncbi:DUF5011 domain-containing protein [Candidatus Saccharibacteria bacterium]|nr:DUF5011 domain-containing protein [Candidatus Saccharibacteria bacterium]
MGKKKQHKKLSFHSNLVFFLVLINLSLFFILVGFWSFTLYQMSVADVKFELKGEEEITLISGEAFSDPGFSADYCTQKKCLDISNLVSTNISDIDSFNKKKTGDYNISYSLFYKNALKTWQKNSLRKVKIIDNKPPELTLSGEETIGIYEGDDFSDPGFSAMDDLEGDITERVSVSGEVNASEPGVYKISYSVSDESGNTSEKQRYIFVYKRWYTFSPTPTKTFDDLAQYVKDMGWDLSFGYYNIGNDKSYTFQGNKIYYGASLVKTLDAMYAYENTNVDSATKNLVRGAITYSNNTSHKALVDQLGFDNLRSYAEQIGMKHHLKGSSIYGDTYYFCDTTIEDQLAEWKHLWHLINTNPQGEELKWYFINNYWDNLSFFGSPTHMYKNGLYGSNYHEVGIIFADSPYIVAMLSTEGWRWNSTTIVKDLSHRIYMINQLVASGEYNL